MGNSLSDVIQLSIVCAGTKVPIFLLDDDNGELPGVVCLFSRSTLFHVLEHFSHLCLLGEWEPSWGFSDEPDLSSIDVVVESVFP